MAVLSVYIYTQYTVIVRSSVYTYILNTCSIRICTIMHTIVYNTFSGVNLCPCIISKCVYCYSYRIICISVDINTKINALANLLIHVCGL